VLRVERQYREGRYKPKPKSAAGFRTVELAAPLARRLLKRRAELGDVAVDAPLFATRIGTPYDDHNVRRALRDAASRVGVERATPHMLRHSIASLLYERGWTDVQVAALLGHEDPSFTRSRYLHAVERGDLSVLDGVIKLGEGG
jgi:integrase